MVPIDDIRSKIQRTKEHIADLKSEIGDFYATDRYKAISGTTPTPANEFCI
jgi:hypothetical protein